jgi:squalene-hopene/tetraprenyl-beta-curcumene cyclase
LRYLHNVQRDDGAFLPLWFGDQEAESKEAPVYGSAVVLEHLGFGLQTPGFRKKVSDFRLQEGMSNDTPNARNPKSEARSLGPDLQKTVAFLLAAQHATGGWGSCNSERDYVTVTARCVTALQPYPEAQTAVERAKDFLQPFAEHPETIPPEPIGLYFAHLWYSEELYGPVFLMNAFNHHEHAKSQS